MKHTLFSILTLSAVAVHAQPDDPPLLRPSLESAEIVSGSVANEGSLVGEFEVRQGDGTVEIVDGDRGRKVLKIAPTAESSVDSSQLPCLVYRKMPVEFPRGVTFQARIKPDPDWQLAQCEVLSGRVSDRGTGMAVTFRPGDRLLDVVSGSGGSDGEVWGIVSNTQTKMTSDGWVHLAAVYDAENKQFRLYLDGQLAAESATDLALTEMLPEFSVGAYRAGYAYPFRGEIGDIEVYDYTRSEEQIRTNAEGR